MNYFIFLLFIQSLPLFANGAQIMVEIEPNWMPLPEYRSLLKPEEHREVFQSKRFELQIYKEGIQEGISIAGSRVRNDRDVFMFENIPEDWMEPTGLVLEIKLPPILSVKKIFLNEESFYHPRIRRPFRILRNRNNHIYKFSILENPERNFRTDIQLPMGETPKGGNEVAYMESLNNSVTKLEQSERLCAQTKYECNLNLLLKYTHISRQFDAFIAATRRGTLTVSAQNFATIRAKSEKLFDDIIKLAVRQIGEEKKIFKENASSSIDLYNYLSPAMPPTLHLHSQHQHGLASSQSSRTQQTPTSGTTSAADAGALPMNRKISFVLMPIEKIAQFLAGLHPLSISQPNPSQINIQSANVPVGQQQQRVVGQTSRGGPSAAQAQEKGKEKEANIVQPPTNVEISSSEENNPNPMARANIPAAGPTINDPKFVRQNVPAVDAGKREFLWKHLVRFENLWTSVHDPSDYAAHGKGLVGEEQRERSKLTNELGLKREQSYRWFFTKRKDLVINKKEKTRKEFEYWKKKYPSKSNVPTAANRIKPINQYTPFNDHQRAALWRHFVKYEDVLFTQSADVNRQKEEEEERSKLKKSIKLKPKQIYNTKSRLNTQEKTRQEYEEKKKYQSEMAATGGDNASASASKVPSTAANEKASNVEVISSNEETDPNPLAIVPYEPIPNDPIDARPLNWLPQADENPNKKGKKRKHSSGIVPVAAGDEKNTKSRLNTQEKTRQEYEEEKKKYQSEMAATGGDNASASASKVPSTAANEKASNVEVISSNEETDPNPLAIVPYEPIPNDPIDARPLNWLPQTEDNQNKKGKKRKHSSGIVPVVAGDEKRAKPNQGTSVSAQAELPMSPAVDLNLNLEQSNPEAEEDKMQEDD